MKTVTKVLIGAVITVILIIGLIVGGLVGLFFAFDRSNTERMQKKAQAEIAGREFGKTTDQNGCMEKGFSFDPPKHYFADMNISGFVSECLKTSRPIANFCDGVPTYDDNPEARDRWIKEQERKKCPEYPNNEPCSQTILGKNSYCSYGTGLKK